MLEIAAACYALAALLAVALAGWLASVVKRDVSLVDTLWSLLFLLALVVYVTLSSSPLDQRGILVLVLVALWSLRLSLHIGWLARLAG